MAEVLITLGIIGTVAAMTLTPLINNTKHKKLEAAFKKSYSNFLNAYNKAMMDYPQTDYSGYHTNTELAEAIYSAYTTSTKLSYSVHSSYVQKVRTYTLKKAELPHCSQLNMGRITADGSTIGITFNCFVNWVTLDTNGLKKGPNAYGHDIFLFTISKTGIVKPATSESEGKVDEEGNFSYNNTPENKEKCSISATSALNGITCAQYALQDKCPNDPTKGYWECLP